MGERPLKVALPLSQNSWFFVIYELPTPLPAKNEVEPSRWDPCMFLVSSKPQMSAVDVPPSVRRRRSEAAQEVPKLENGSVLRPVLGHKSARYANPPLPFEGEDALAHKPPQT